MKPPATRYARTPDSVLSDPELSHADVRVFGALSMHAFGGNIVSIGQRRLAEIARVDRRSVRRSLEALARQGHISTAITTLLKRSVYQLHSPIFLQDSVSASGVETRPIMGVETRPRIDIERGGLVSFPKKRSSQ